MFRKFSGSIKKTILCSVAILLFFLLISPISIAQEDANGADDEGLIPGDQPATDGAVPVDDGDHKPVDEEQTSGEKNETGSDKERLPLMPWWAAVVIVVAVIAAGFWMVHIGCYPEERFNSGEIRRAIAAVLVLGFVIITVLSMLYEIPNKEIVSSYTQLVGVIIGFYFGSRVASESGESANGDADERVEGNDKGIANIAAFAKFTEDLNKIADNVKKLEERIK